MKKKNNREANRNFLRPGSHPFPFRGLLGLLSFLIPPWEEQEPAGVRLRAGLSPPAWGVSPTISEVILLGFLFSLLIDFQPI